MVLKDLRKEALQEACCNDHEQQEKDSSLFDHLFQNNYHRAEEAKEIEIQKLTTVYMRRIKQVTEKGSQSMRVCHNSKFGRLRLDQSSGGNPRNREFARRSNKRIPHIGPASIRLNFKSIHYRHSRNPSS